MTQFSTKFVAYSQVLSPTLTGVIIYLILSFITLLIHLVPHLQGYFKVPTNWHIGGIAVTIINDFLIKLIGTSKLDTIVLSIFWMGVGLGVYLFIKGAVTFFVEMSEDIGVSKHYLQPKYDASRTELRHLVGRGLFQVMALFLALLYAIWIIEYSANWSVSGNSAFGAWLNTFPGIQDGLLFIVECIGWHILTILLRLGFLRVRLFG
jgi:hypothetical protein